MNIDQARKSNLTRGINDLSVCGLYIVTDTRNFAILNQDIGNALTQQGGAFNKVRAHVYSFFRIALRFVAGV